MHWRDWLTVSGQAALEVTAGRVFRDDPGHLTLARAAIDWYPDDVWLLVLAVAWRRVADDLPILGRVASRGDALGAGILTARLVENLMRLGFLLERRWAPWSKWLATAFAALPRAGALSERLRSMLGAGDWPALRVQVTDVVGELASMQRELGLPTPDAPLQPFFDRPFETVAGETIDLLQAAIADPELRGVTIGLVPGAIDGWCRDEALLSDPVRRARLAREALPRD